MGGPAPSLHRESTDSLIYILLLQHAYVFLHPFNRVSKEKMTTVLQTVLLIFPLCELGMVRPFVSEVSHYQQLILCVYVSLCVAVA